MNRSDFLGLSDSKRRERFELNRFAECYPGFPDGNRRFTDRPDLIVTTMGGNLGIEHTSLYKDGSRKQGSLQKGRESFRKRVVELAQKEYEKTTQVTLYVQVCFDERLPQTTRKCELVASELAQAVTNISSTLTSTSGANHITAFEYKRRFGNDLPREVSQISVLQVKDADYVVWFASMGHVVPELEVATVQAAIDDKAPKLFDYKKNCDEVWLLVASDGLYPSSHFILSAQVRSHIFNTQFDRVFFLNGLTGDVLELKKG